MVRRSVVYFISLIFSVSLSGFALAETNKEQVKEIISNETIVRMVKANLGETLIIAKIKNSKSSFDLSTDGIIKLKEAGVSEKIIMVMMGAGEASPTHQSATPEDTKGQATSGSLQLPATGDFFLLHKGRLIEIEEHSGYQRLEGIGKVFFTAGLVGDIMNVVNGEEAMFRMPVSDKSLVFISRIKIDTNGNQGGDLFKLDVDDKKRSMVITSYSLSSAGDIKKGYKVKYDVKKNEDGTYTITTEGALEHGEYAFVVGFTGSRSEPSKVRFFDFGIDAEFDEPIAIATDKNDNIYVLDIDKHRISKYIEQATPNLKPVFLQWLGKKGDRPAELRSPQKIAIGQDNLIYVADTDNHRIQVFDTEGNHVKTWGKKGKNDGEMKEPHGIAIGDDGAIYVTDNGNRRILKFDKNGNLILKFGRKEEISSGMMAIAVDAKGNIYVVDENKHGVVVFNQKGELVKTIGKKGKAEGYMNDPSDIAIDQYGNIYIVDSDNRRVQKFDAKGNFLLAFGKEGKGPGEFGKPSGIGLSKKGNIYVTDTGLERILVFDSSGKFLGDWGREKKY